MIVLYSKSVPRTASRLQQELRQTRPFASIHHEAVLSVLKTASLLRLEIARNLEPEGVTPQQYNVLRILRGAGAAGLPTLAIGERLVEETPGITRLLDKMEARGWVARVRSTDDRRQVLCTITAGGLRLLERLAPRVEALNERFAAAISSARAEQLAVLLESIREGLT